MGVWSNAKTNVLDKGFVRVVETMGDDASIVQAARVSYASGSKGLAADEKLIRYLMKNKHTSPFEMCEIKLHIKAPIFVARQWVRHRTANWNEISGRYTEVNEEFYVPDTVNIKKQSYINKQARSPEGFTDGLDSHYQGMIEACSEGSYRVYRNMVDGGVARELARIVLPTNFYTEWYWKIDLHNLMGFLRQRLDEHAQFEIREYANAIDKIVQDWLPVTHKAFVDSMSSTL